MRPTGDSFRFVFLRLRAGKGRVGWCYGLQGSPTPTRPCAAFPPDDRTRWGLDEARMASGPACGIAGT